MVGCLSRTDLGEAPIGTEVAVGRRISANSGTSFGIFGLAALRDVVRPIGHMDWTGFPCFYKNTKEQGLKANRHYEVSA
jgi:hypothetical protein